MSMQEPSQIHNGNGKQALEQGNVIQDGDVAQKLRVKRRQLSGVVCDSNPTSVEVATQPRRSQ